MEVKFVVAAGSFGTEEEEAEGFEEAYDAGCVVVASWCAEEEREVEVYAVDVGA